MNNESLSLDEALARAKSLSRKGRTDEAIQLYQSILASVPHHKKARKELKLLNKRSAASHDPRLHQDMSELMRVYSEGAPGEALSLATRLATQYPDQPLPLNIAGALTLENEDTESAIELFKQAVQLEPAYTDAHSNLAFALFKMKRFELAHDHYRTALSLSPQDANLHYHFGQTQRALGNREDAMKQWQSALAIDPGHSKSMVAIGRLFTDASEFVQAEKHFLEAIEIDPDSVGAFHGLGYALGKAGRVEDATMYLNRALNLNPENLEAIEIRFMLKALTGNSTDSIPATYMTNFFDAFATNFEKQLVEVLEYHSPQFLRAAFSKVVPHIDLFSTALDVGCGTGLCGVAFRDITESIDGVDISEKMLEKAREKRLYRNLWSGDVLDVLTSVEEKYRLVIAADVFIYIGNLEPIFNALAQQMSADAYFTFSTEHATDGELSLEKSLRYTHSRAYIERIAKASGFEVVYFETHKLRKEGKQWVIGGAYILHKP
ncbi:MAG: tetratricopeptide repeat protein [Halioglobus sp.]